MAYTPQLSDYYNELLVALQTSEAFHGFPLEVLAEVIGMMDIVTLAKSKNLYKQGDMPKAIYLVLKGALKTSSHENSDETLVNQLSVGDIIGETEIITGEVRCDTIIAKEDAALTSLSREIGRASCRERV